MLDELAQSVNKFDNQHNQQVKIDVLLRQIEEAEKGYSEQVAVFELKARQLSAAMQSLNEFTMFNISNNTSQLSSTL